MLGFNGLSYVCGGIVILMVSLKVLGLVEICLHVSGILFEGLEV
jgi:hypothetical protein